MRKRKEALFEQAEGGTLLLDEIGELELSLQAKLLRVLEEGAFRRVGGLKDLPLNVRVPAASNRDLSQRVTPVAFASTSITDCPLSKSTSQPCANVDMMFCF